MKSKKTFLTLPDNLQLIKEMPEDPPELEVYASQTESAACMYEVSLIPDAAAMPKDDVPGVINGLHNAIGEDQGIIRVENGSTPINTPYIYTIVKSIIPPEEGGGATYTLCINLFREEKVAQIRGFFQETGTTGMRDAVILAKLQNAGEVVFSENGLVGWTEDPYDPDFSGGIQMNKSELEEYDSVFPDHPLSVCREFVSYVIENN